MTPRKLLLFGPLPIRIMSEIAFIVAALPKFESISVNQGFFSSLELPPELAQFVIAVFELPIIHSTKTKPKKKCS
jgi:hypothetical protein